MSVQGICTLRINSAYVVDWLLSTGKGNPEQLEDDDDDDDDDDENTDNSQDS